MKIGICGVGFVGSAISQSLVNNNECSIIAYDKYKNLNTFEMLLDSDICFICLPTRYDAEKKTYDVNELDKTLLLFSEHGYNGIILMKSTVLPTYCSDRNDRYPNLRIIHNPEFLSARTALEDFSTQKHIILGYTKQSYDSINKIITFYNHVFPQTLLSICQSEEAELTKLACNGFYAMKVQYFTELFLLCDKLSLSFDLIKEMMLKNGWIHPQHTSVPGHDGQLSFGGACLPKDISAFNEYMKALTVPCKVIEAVVNERNEMRE